MYHKISEYASKYIPYSLGNSLKYVGLTGLALIVFSGCCPQYPDARKEGCCSIVIENYTPDKPGHEKNDQGGTSGNNRGGTSGNNSGPAGK